MAGTAMRSAPRRRLDFVSTAPVSTSLPVRVTLGVLLSWAVAELRAPGQGPEGRTLEWCAFTIIVLASPTLGSVASKGLDRTVGTALGGLLCVALCFLTLDSAILTAASFFVAVAAVYFADAFKKDYSAKLFVLTFLIIAIGAEASTHGQIVQLALLRVQGIVEGVVIVNLLTVLLWPQAASTQAVASIREALASLEQLQDNVWENGAISAGWGQLAANSAFKLRVDEAYLDDFLPAGLLDKTDKAEAVPGDDSGVGAEQTAELSARRASLLTRLMTLQKGAFQGMGQLPLNTLEDMEEMERRQELVIDSILASLAKAEASAAESPAEIYVGSLRGWPIFLPGLSFRWAQLGWRVPTAELKALAASIRKVTRVYWSMQRAFQEGFDEQMMRAVAQRYPTHMLTTLQDHSAAVLQDMVAVFPEPGKLIPQDTQTKVEALLELCTDIKACEALASERQAAELRHLLSALGRGAQPAATLERKLQRLETLARERVEPGGAEAEAPAAPGTAAPTTQAGENSRTSLDEVLGMARDMSRQNLLEVARDGAPRAQPGLAKLRMTSLTRVMGNALRSKMQAFVSDYWSGNTTNQEEVDGEAEGEESAFPAPEARSSRGKGPAVLSTFPDTREGHICKVRWYSFLFLLEQLAVALVEMHERVDAFVGRLPAGQRVRTAQN